MHAIAGQHPPIGHTRFLQRLQDLPAGGILVNQNAFVLFGDVAHRLIVRQQFLIFQAEQVLLDHRGCEQRHANVAPFRQFDHPDQLFFILWQRHRQRTIALGMIFETVPDIVDADADGHPIRGNLQHVPFVSVEHICRFVPADAGIDKINSHLRIQHFHRPTQKVDIAVRPFAAFGDAVAERHNNLPILQERLLAVKKNGKRAHEEKKNTQIQLHGLSPCRIRAKR